MATNSSFRLPKALKRLLSHAPAGQKQLMIDAELSYQQGKNRKFSDPAQGNNSKQSAEKTS